MAKNTDDVIKKLTKAMEEVQSSKRFLHTLGVEYTAAALAMRYDVPILSAQIAGLLHDCAKPLSDEKQLKICEKNNLVVRDVEKRNPYLLHSKVGAFLAKTEYGIDDQDILNAIEFHTTGRPEMSTLEKIVFIADFIEPGRKDAYGLPEIRKMAFQDLDIAMVRILEDTLRYLMSNDRDIDPLANDAYGYYLGIHMKKYERN